jgi:hypothetical protein
MQLARSWESVIGPHSIASRFLRKPALLRNRAEYASLSRTLALASGSLVGIAWASAAPPKAAVNNTASVPARYLRMLMLLIRGQSVIVSSLPTLDTVR